jgi:hypothetical protein
MEVMDHWDMLSVLQFVRSASGSTCPRPTTVPCASKGSRCASFETTEWSTRSSSWPRSMRRTIGRKQQTEPRTPQYCPVILKSRVRRQRTISEKKMSWVQRRPNEAKEGQARHMARMTLSSLAHPSCLRFSSSDAQSALKRRVLLTMFLEKIIHATFCRNHFLLL